MGIFGWSLPPGCGTLPGEETGAWETQLDGVWYAWDEDDRIYRQDPDHPDAGEDGYVYIGTLAWPQDDEPVPALRQALEEKQEPFEYWSVAKRGAKIDDTSQKQGETDEHRRLRTRLKRP